MRRGGIVLALVPVLALALALGGCATAPPPASVPVVETEPPYRNIIAQHLDTLFSQDSQMRGISISGARRAGTPAGPEWRVCLRGSARNVTGGVSGRTYVVFINRHNAITDRRLARPEDACNQERYERLARA